MGMLKQVGNMVKWRGNKNITLAWSGNIRIQHDQQNNAAIPFYLFYLIRAQLSMRNVNSNLN